MNYAWGNSPELSVKELAPQAAEGHPAEIGVRDIVLPRPYISSINADSHNAKLGEILDNYQIIEDPKGEDRGEPATFGVTVANADAADQGIVVRVSTSGSSLKNNPSNAVELADDALVNPGIAFAYVESLGNGNTSALTDEEQKAAKKDGMLVSPIPGQGRNTVYEAFPTIQAMARALDTLKGDVTHISADDTGAHIASALLSALPAGTMERAFLYNPTNLRNLSSLSYGAGKLIAMTYGNLRYGSVSEDRLAVSKGRRQDAIDVLGKEFASKTTQLRSVRQGTFNPGKMKGEVAIFRRGKHHGQAARAHAVGGLQRHPDLKITYGFAANGPNYPGTEKAAKFLLSVYEEAGLGIEFDQIRGVELPLGQYGHTYQPQARMAAQNHAFRR